jgi:SAM-dependent methyltransferase
MQNIEQKIYDTETERFRDILSPYCVGNGIDLGYGGDPIIVSAITMDLPNPYSKGKHPINLKGDASSLYWFKDDVLDYVYSSHLLEDFDDKFPILKEWIRVIRHGGVVVLLLPDEQKYRNYCLRINARRNKNHKDPDFCMAKVIEILGRLNVEIVKEYPSLVCNDGTDYSFAVIGRKI